MKITIPLEGDMSLKSDIEGWYQIEVDTAKKYDIDLKDYTLDNIVYGMAERGKYSNSTSKCVDAYELHLIKKK